MKLLVVTSLKEYQKSLAEIMEQVGIAAFSVTETIGFKDYHEPNLLDNWFSSGGEQFDSIFLFSFIDSTQADRALLLIKTYNTENNNGFPIRAFVMPVETSS
jgi:hypothetical protein